MENKINKKSAVDFLIKEFSDILGTITTKPMTDLLLLDAIQKAKEMEKEQIKNAWYDGWDFGNVTAEKYYNKTFGN